MRNLFISFFLVAQVCWLFCTINHLVIFQGTDAGWNRLSYLFKYFSRLLDQERLNCINSNTAELPQLVQAKRLCYISQKIPAVGNFYIPLKLVDFELCYCLAWWGPQVQCFSDLLIFRPTDQLLLCNNERKLWLQI